jgi:hypothetical protein
MTELLRGWTRRLSPIALALVLLLGGSEFGQTVRAQEPAAPDAAASGDKGRPLDGYLATACLAVLVLFLVGKSARR